ncbi:uncharacterized protein LOC127244279 [Andrographis paniculata]|uniref:uncharacterized protein LOC127244279 n=1 Tax=Andrographis paniculata TaxID=175694 RepID=UPI0021E8F888|nr:uncharacterized protein LOC127244279 [Andrographis paniculata]
MASRESKLLVLLVLVILQVGTGVMAEGRHFSRPGFLYTRTRGRCTPQYWSSRREAWPKMVPERSTVWKVFGWQATERYRKELTLAEAASMEEEEEGAFGRLVKQSTAALINSYMRRGYPYAPWEVKTLLIQSLVSAEAAAFQAHKFRQANDNCG